LILFKAPAAIQSALRLTPRVSPWRSARVGGRGGFEAARVWSISWLASVAFLGRLFAFPFQAADLQFHLHRVGWR
jgi:hypothetical protein